MQKGEKKKASESTVHNAILRSPAFRADALPYKTNRNESSSAKNQTTRQQLNGEGFANAVGRFGGIH
jgi:hypothetical protein